jgi:hypothetical protein
VRSWFRCAALLGLLAPGAPLLADDILFQTRAVSCVATTPDVIGMRVDHVGFAVLGRHPSAHARVHLQLRDNSEATFDVSGKAVRIDKDIAPNSEGRSLAYAGVECTLTHRNVIAVQDCIADAGTRTCEVAIEIGHDRRAYLVSLSITPVGTGVAPPTPDSRSTR